MARTRPAVIVVRVAVVVSARDGERALPVLEYISDILRVIVTCKSRGKRDQWHQWADTQSGTNRKEKRGGGGPVGLLALLAHHGITHGSV